MPHIGGPGQSSTKTPVFDTSSNSESWAHAAAGWALGRRARARSRPGAVGAGNVVRLPTCFCSSFSPLIVSSTGNNEWVRREMKPARGDSDVCSLQLATRRPSIQAIVAIFAFLREPEPQRLGGSPPGSTNPGLRCPHQSARGVGVQQPITLRCLLKAALARYRPLSGNS